MTHPNPKAPGNVPLYRCRDAYKPNCDFPSTCVFARHNDAFKVGQYSSCHVAVKVGFRTPPRCEDCDRKDPRDGFCHGADRCDVDSKSEYTPRQPGKEKV